MTEKVSNFLKVFLLIIASKRDLLSRDCRLSSLSISIRYKITANIILLVHAYVGLFQAYCPCDATTPQTMPYILFCRFFHHDLEAICREVACGRILPPYLQTGPSASPRESTTSYVQPGLIWLDSRLPHLVLSTFRELSLFPISALLFVNINILSFNREFSL